jgi:hypothetical protein
MKRILPWALAATLLGCAASRAAIIDVTTDVTSDTTWTADNTYLLQTVVYVRGGATLTIEPGTVVKGSTNETSLVARDGIPNLVSALWVARGAKLMAQGTSDKPIIFTFQGDDVTVPNDVPFNTSGQWGGIVLCGRGQLNSAAFAEGNAATPKFERFEGTTTDGIEGAHLFGGNDDTDSSGALRYVSIRYPGNVFAPARELNGLTMAGVGSGTTIEYVEVLNSSDDGFEWWGGNVSTKYLVAAFCEDDDFDTDQGYRGTNQFWFGIKPPWNGSSDSRGFETDGDLNQNASGEAPKCQWTVSHATLIGRSSAEAGFGGGIAWNARDEAAPTVINTIFTAFAAGVKVDGDGLAEFDAGLADLRNSIFGVPANAGTSDANAAYLFTDTARTNSIADPLLGGISYTNDVATLDPRPQTGSPALSNVLPVPAGLQQVNYRGAFSQTDNWADGWTALSKAGFLKEGTVQPPAPPEIAGSISASGTEFVVTLTSVAGVTYQLQSAEDLGANPINWVDAGDPIPGTGNPISFSQELVRSGHKLFRVVAR